MRILIQRVKEAKVTTEGQIIGSIGKGLLIFLAIHRDDQPETVSWLVNKLLNLRLFADDQGKMNLNPTCALSMTDLMRACFGG